MKHCIYILLISILYGCNGNESNEFDDTVALESEIVSQTIEELTPGISEIRLIVPAKGGELSSVLKSREEIFWPEHNRIKKNNRAYFILSNELSVPSAGERYLTEHGLSKSFTNFLYHTAKAKKNNHSNTKRLFGLAIKIRKVNHEDYSLLNKPGCYGYIEYSRMQFSNDNKKAQFIFKYRLNNGMDITQLISVSKDGDNWLIEDKEDILVSHENPTAPIGPTAIIDTVYAPPYNDDSFEIKFNTDSKGKNPLPRGREIIITVRQNAFDSEFLKYVSFDFSMDRSWNDLEKIEFSKLSDTTYKVIIDECYSEPDIMYDVRITPKRGYIYSDYLEASQSHRFVDHLGAASLDVRIKSIDQTSNSNCD